MPEVDQLEDQTHSIPHVNYNRNSPGRVVMTVLQRATSSCTNKIIYNAWLVEWLIITINHLFLPHAVFLLLKGRCRCRCTLTARWGTECTCTFYNNFFFIYVTQSSITYTADIYQYMLTLLQVLSEPASSESSELLLQSRHRMSTNNKTTTIVTDINIINVVLKCQKVYYCNYRKGNFGNWTLLYMFLSHFVVSTLPKWR